MPDPCITRVEWRRVGILAALVLALTTLPYVVGGASQGAGWRFSGFLFGLDDGNSYLAKMRLGAVGEWAFRIVYTSEPHAAVFVFAPYLLGGKLAALMAAPGSPELVAAMLWVFHVARLAFGLTLILITYRFAAYYLVAPPARLAATALIALGGGLGWVLPLIGQDNWLGSLPIDFIVPEGYSFYLLYGLPHLSLARSGLLGGLMLLFAALQTQPRRGWRRQAGLAGACWLVMGLCVPFYLAVLYVLLGLWGLMAWGRHRQFPVALFWRCVVAAAVPAPYLVYTLLAFGANPVMSAWQAQNTLPSPHPLHYVIGYGLLAVIAFPAMRWAWRRGATRLPYLLLVTWVLAALILVYLPINVQRRLLEGVYVPLVILAVAGLRYAWTRTARRQVRVARWRVAITATFCLLLPTTGMILMGGLLAARSPSDYNRAFLPAAEVAALDWLNANAPHDAVALSNARVGNAIPAYASLRAFVGHGPETLDYAGKAEIAAHALRGEMSAAQWSALLATHQIAYVILSPEDRRTTTTSPFAGVAVLEPVYDQGGYAIFRVRRD